VFIEEYGYLKSTTNDFQELVKDLENKHDTWFSYFVAKKEYKSTFTIDDLPKEYQKLLNPLSAKIYSVQLGVFKNPNNFDTSLITDFGKTHYLKTETGLTTILIGEYKTYEEAKLVKNKITKQGQDAIVIALKNGRKTPL
jgi:hypothetical protein